MLHFLHCWHHHFFFFFCVLILELGVVPVMVKDTDFIFWIVPCFLFLDSTSNFPHIILVSLQIYFFKVHLFLLKILVKILNCFVIQIDRNKYIAFLERESKRSRKHTHIMYKPYIFINVFLNCFDRKWAYINYALMRKLFYLFFYYP